MSVARAAGPRRSELAILFNSLAFLAFFVGIVPLAWVFRSSVRVRNVILLVGSYFFYGCWDPRFLALIAFSTVVDYFAGRALAWNPGDEDKPRTKRDRGYLTISLVTNLGLLAVFKYLNFFIDGAADLATQLGFQPNVHSLEIILPVGISFYTFQTLSYTIDCYRRRIPAERDFLGFALFVAFFPQLVAGPIERATKLMPQIQRATQIDWNKISQGIYLICAGLFKKVVIADNVAVVANSALSLQDPSGLDVTLGVYAFAIQIYCDFSGYSDIARGTARCMGFELMLNFNAPYFARNPSDFWRRWHISLSTWLRDYLYIPLGGNRVGPVRNYVNLMLTMVIGGLWHGAAWTYLLWGFYQGALLCVHRVMEPLLVRLPKFRTGLLAKTQHVITVALFFQLVCLGWLIFRAESLPHVWAMLRAIGAGGLSISQDIPDGNILGLAAAVPALVILWCARASYHDEFVAWRLPSFPRGLLYAGAVVCFLCFGAYGGDDFIYFQF